MLLLLHGVGTGDDRSLKLERLVLLLVRPIIGHTQYHEAVPLKQPFGSRSDYRRAISNVGPFVNLYTVVIL